MHIFTQASAGGFQLDPLTIGMLAILAVLIFFMIRNGKKRKEQMAELQTKMVPGARVMTNFGLYGDLVALDDDSNEAQLEIAPGVIITVHRQVVARVVEDEAAPSQTGESNGTAGDEPLERP